MKKSFLAALLGVALLWSTVAPEAQAFSRWRRGAYYGGYPAYYGGYRYYGYPAYYGGYYAPYYYGGGYVNTPWFGIGW